ncbi:MAG: hypothetical protein Q9217_006265, partial [Psora testacea]
RHIASFDFQCFEYRFTPKYLDQLSTGLNTIFFQELNKRQWLKKWQLCRNRFLQPSQATKSNSSGASSSGSPSPASFASTANASSANIKPSSSNRSAENRTPIPSSPPPSSSIIALGTKTPSSSPVESLANITIVAPASSSHSFIQSSQASVGASSTVPFGSRSAPSLDASSQPYQTTKNADNIPSAYSVAIASLKTASNPPGPTASSGAVVFAGEMLVFAARAKTLDFSNEQDRKSLKNEVDSLVSKIHSLKADLPHVDNNDGGCGKGKSLFTLFDCALGSLTRLTTAITKAPVVPPVVIAELSMVEKTAKDIEQKKQEEKDRDNSQSAEQSQPTRTKQSTQISSELSSSSATASASGTPSLYAVFFSGDAPTEDKKEEMKQKLEVEAVPGSVTSWEYTDRKENYHFRLYAKLTKDTAENITLENPGYSLQPQCGSDCVVIDSTISTTPIPNAARSLMRRSNDASLEKRWLQRKLEKQMAPPPELRFLSGWFQDSLGGINIPNEYSYDETAGLKGTIYIFAFGGDTRNTAIFPDQLPYTAPRFIMTKASALPNYDDQWGTCFADKARGWYNGVAKKAKLVIVQLDLELPGYGMVEGLGKVIDEMVSARRGGASSPDPVSVVFPFNLDDSGWESSARQVNRKDIIILGQDIESWGGMVVAAGGTTDVEKLIGDTSGFSLGIPAAIASKISANVVVVGGLTQKGESIQAYANGALEVINAFTVTIDLSCFNIESKVDGTSLGAVILGAVLVYFQSLPDGPSGTEKVAFPYSDTAEVTLKYTNERAYARGQGFPNAVYNGDNIRQDSLRCRRGGIISKVPNARRPTRPKPKEAPPTHKLRRDVGAGENDDGYIASGDLKVPQYCSLVPDETSATLSTTLISSAMSSTTLISSTTPSTTLISSATSLMTLISSATSSTTLISSATSLMTLISSATSSTTLISSAMSSTTLISSATSSTTLISSAMSSTTLISSTTPSTTLTSSATSLMTPISSATSSTTLISTAVDASTSISSGVHSIAYSSSLAAPPAKPTLEAGDVECNGLQSLKYISPQDLDQNIDDFCTQAEKQGTQDAGSGSVQRTLNANTPEEISLSTDWPPGLAGFKPTKDACKEYMSSISRKCDGNDPANPMNWKGGGILPVKLGDATIKYNIQPIAKRPRVFTTPLAHVEITGLKFWLNGSGWSNKDNGDCLKNYFNGCLGSGYNFRYGVGDDDREWTMTGWAGPGKGGCCRKAVTTCGGPNIGWE